jgi:hypothetical protein
MTFEEIEYVLEPHEKYEVSYAKESVLHLLYMKMVSFLFITSYFIAPWRPSRHNTY